MNEEIKYLDYEGLQDFKQRLDLQLQNAINTVNESISQLDNDKADINDISHEAIIEDANGHEYVEIAGIKWATCNVGADNPDDEGLYFAWGETTGYTSEQVGTDKNFSWEDYELTEDDGTTMTKYNSTDEKTILELTDDVASINMGGSWRMPTAEELQALSAAVNTQWTNNYNDTGVSGLICTDKTDSSKVLFFPAAGGCSYGSVFNVGSNGYYWSGSLYADFGELYAYYMYFNSDDVSWVNGDGRYYGFSVRGVLGTVETKVQGTTITEAEREYWNSKANTSDIVQSDWNQTDNSAKDYIKNKPTIPSLSGYATENYVDNKIDDILGINASGISDLLSILNDDDKATGILNVIANKADKTELFSGSYNDLTDKPSSMSVVAITGNTSSSCSITGANNSGKQQLIIYTNNTGSDLLVTVPTTYTTPNGQGIELLCINGGYCEVSYININGTIYARGL